MPSCDPSAVLMPSVFPDARQQEYPNLHAMVRLWKLVGILPTMGNTPAGSTLHSFCDSSIPRPDSLPLWNPEFRIERSSSSFIYSGQNNPENTITPAPSSPGSLPYPHIYMHLSMTCGGSCQMFPGITSALVWSFLDPGEVFLSLRILPFHKLLSTSALLPLPLLVLKH